MASGDGTSDGLGREQHSRTKSLGKVTQENKASAALESQSGLEKNQNPEVPSTQNVAHDLTLSKGKRAVQGSKCGHDSDDPNKQSSTSCPIGSFRDGPGIFPSSNQERIIAVGPSSSSKKSLIQALQEMDSQTHGPHPAHSNLEGVAASVAPAGSIAVEPRVGSVAALLGEASLEPNGGPLLVLNDVGRAEPNVGPIVVLHGVALSQSNVAFIVAPLGEIIAQPNIAPNVARPAPTVVVSSVAPRRVAPVQPDVAPHAQRNGALPAPVQPNAALIVAPPGEILVEASIAPNVAPPAPAVVAPRGVAPVQPDIAPQAQRNGPPPAPAQPNAALIVGPPDVALAQPNAALVLAPSRVALAQPNAVAMVDPAAVVVLDVNRGLKRSRLKPLRICEIGSEGNFWPKLPRI